MHCDLINDKGAAGEDIERLGETVRARVKASWRHGNIRARRCRFDGWRAWRGIGNFRSLMDSQLVFRWACTSDMLEQYAETRGDGDCELSASEHSSRIFDQ